jgi:hypothetical protein
MVGFLCIMGSAKGIERPLIFNHSRRVVAQEIQHTWGANFCLDFRLCNRNSIHKLFTPKVFMDVFVLKSNFSAHMPKIVWAVYTVSWHSIGNVTHFKEITSLKQTNLQVVSLTSSFYINLTSAYFCSMSYHRQPPHYLALCQCDHSANIITHHLRAQCWNMYSFPSNYFAH